MAVSLSVFVLMFSTGPQCVTKADNSEQNLWQNVLDLPLQLNSNSAKQAGRRLVRSLLTLSVFVVDVMDLRTRNRNEDDS